MKLVHKIAVIALSCLLVAGCTTGAGKETAQENRVLKVMFNDEQFFYQEYGDLFAMEYPNTEIEVISMQKMYNQQSQDQQVDYSTLLTNFIEEEQPDVVMIDTSTYEKLATGGKLEELDSLIERDKYDTSTISSGIIESLREIGGNKLYGLAPKFDGQALFYNVDLFKKYGIEPPQDGMTWEQILDLARRFPTEGSEDERIYGFGSDYGLDFNSLSSEISRTNNLNNIDTKTKKITMNTDSWKNVYKTTLDAINSNTVYNPKDRGFQGGSMEEYYKSQLFMMGRIAMTVNSPYILRNIKDASDQLKDYKSFEIGIVSGPINPTEPDTSYNASIYYIFGIRAGAPNKEAAWDFVKFINGEKYAKIKSRTINNGLMTRTGVTTEYNGHSLEAFYKLKPKFQQWGDESEIPREFYEPYYEITSRELQLIQDNKKTIEDALATIQDEGQALLDKTIKEAETKKTNGDANSTNSSNETSSDGVSVTSP